MPTGDRYLLCIANDGHPASLEVRKVYRSLPDETAAERGFVRVVDESGEDYLYPAAWFIAVELPDAAANVFATTTDALPDAESRHPMPNVEDLLNEAMKLSRSERAELTELLVAQEHVPTEDLSAEEYERAWRSELAKRIAAADRGEYAEGDWRDVIERARRASERRPSLRDMKPLNLGRVLVRLTPDDDVMGEMLER